MSNSREQIYKEYFEQHPLHKLIGIKIDRIESKKAEVSIPINSNTINIAGSLHGGVIYLVSDVASFVSLEHSLGESEYAVTIDLQCSVYKAASDSTILFKAELTKRTRRLAFINVQVFGGEQDLIAEARVTKAIIKKVPETLK